MPIFSKLAYQLVRWKSRRDLRDDGGNVDAAKRTLSMTAEKQHVVAPAARRFLAERRVKDIPLGLTCSLSTTSPAILPRFASTKTPSVHRFSALFLCAIPIYDEE